METIFKLDGAVALHIPSELGAIRNSVVERPLMMRQIVGSIPYGGPIELYFCQTERHE